jgi:Fe-S-cluster containining protein
MDGEQRFTCSQCGRCCTRPWQIVVTPSEAESYRKADVARFYRESATGPEGAKKDPFELISRTKSFHRIRKRDDGACGFLSPAGRCRLHEELGGMRKPLTCRMFPWSFHPVEGAVAVGTSFCCPTTIANEGQTTEGQRSEIQALRAEWFAVYPEKPKAVRFAERRVIDAAALETVRSLLKQLLDRPGPDGRPDLRENVLRMARVMEDWTRYRVLRLPGEALGEYFSLTGGHALVSQKPVAPRPPSRLARLLLRGFLFVVAATRLQFENQSTSAWRLGLRLRLFGLLAHLHGLGPGVSGIDLRLARRAPVPFEADPELAAIARHYLRASIESLGSGKRTVASELSVAVAFLDAACALASMRAAREGRAVDRAIFSEALMEAVDLTHADDEGRVGRILGTLASGVESLYAFAAGWPARPKAQPSLPRPEGGGVGHADEGV